MTNAEWVCTACGTTNRKLVSPDQERVEDRCLTCKAWYVVERGPRPAFWEATPKP